jgi:hypothetical protein
VSSFPPTTISPVPSSPSLLEICPKGDDPFTENQSYRAINITTSASSGTLEGQFQLSFQGEYFYFNANANSFNETQCEIAFAALPNVEEVSCSRTTPTADQGATYTIQFLSFPSKPYENNIYHHDGNPPLSYFQCQTSLVTGATSPSCLLSDVTQAAEIKGNAIP